MSTLPSSAFQRSQSCVWRESSTVSTDSLIPDAVINGVLPYIFISYIFNWLILLSTMLSSFYLYLSLCQDCISFSSLKTISLCVWIHPSSLVYSLMDSEFWITSTSFGVTDSTALIHRDFCLGVCIMAWIGNL